MVSCPSCSRANGDERHACVYCGAALVDDAVIARELADELLPSRPRGRTGLAIAVLPGQESAANVARLATILDCEAFAASQLLRRVEPLVLACVNRADADSLAAEIQSAGLRFVELDYSRVDAIEDALLMQRVQLDTDTLTTTTVDGEIELAAYSDVEGVIVGRVEVSSSREELETRFRSRGDGEDIRRVETRASTDDYDAFTVFDLYARRGPRRIRVRLLESVTTLEGPDYPKARRGAGFTRFARWLTARHSGVYVDERYVQLGKDDRRSEFAASDRLLSHGFMRSKEVLGTHQEYSGQEFDDYSATAWTLWELTRGIA